MHYMKQKREKSAQKSSKNHKIAYFSNKNARFRRALMLGIIAGGASRRPRFARGQLF